jgi:4-hydroxy-tetrahydrodipicolinate synthase
MILESVRMGAVGWIAGLVNALPRETMALFDAARAGQMQKADELYRWFLPLLRMDTVPKFVQAHQARAAGSRHGPRARARGPAWCSPAPSVRKALGVIRAVLQRRPAP